MKTKTWTPTTAHVRYTSLAAVDELDAGRCPNCGSHRLVEAPPNRSWAATCQSCGWPLGGDR
jgi:uncharacterized protein (DUF983 family)